MRYINTPVIITWASAHERRRRSWAKPGQTAMDQECEEAPRSWIFFKMLISCTGFSDHNLNWHTNVFDFPFLFLHWVLTHRASANIGFLYTLLSIYSTHFISGSQKEVLLVHFNLFYCPKLRGWAHLFLRYLVKFELKPMTPQYSPL